MGSGIAQVAASNGCQITIVDSSQPALENSKSRLEALKNKIEAIENCDLKKNASKIVFADGNIQSSIMIIGEGPGQKEDELGKPFVGDAGNLLNKMLKAINIERDKIYITNVVNLSLIHISEPTRPY